MNDYLYPSNRVSEGVTIRLTLETLLVSSLAMSKLITLSSKTLTTFIQKLIKKLK